MLIAGVDEAGRGPCFGPMVISIALIDLVDEKKLKDLGVKDSKELSESARDRIAVGIKEHCVEIKSCVLQPAELNILMDELSLNEIEAIKIAELIDKLDSKPDKIFIDSPDVLKGAFEKRIRKYSKTKAIIVAENKADSNYVIAGAASIIAKTTRDNEIKKLHDKYGDFGSGYPSDEKTIKWLKAFVQKNKSLPIFSRTHWATCKNVMNDLLQEKLF